MGKVDTVLNSSCLGIYVYHQNPAAAAKGWPDHQNRQPGLPFALDIKQRQSLGDL